MTDQNNETTELDVYRPHLAELGTQDGPTEMERMLQEARAQSAGVILGQCSLDTKKEWSRQMERIIEEAADRQEPLLFDECHTARDGTRPRDWLEQEPPVRYLDMREIEKDGDGE